MPSSLLKFEKKLTAKIFGRRYPIVKIGNQLWMAENLDYAWEGLSVGGPWDATIAKAYYYDNDENTYGAKGKKYGLLYNDIAVGYLRNILYDGWHIPNDIEWNTLMTTIGCPGQGDGGYGTIYYNAGTLLKSKSEWDNNGNGTDQYGFNAKPSGRISKDSLMFESIGELCEFATAFTYSSYRWLYYIRKEYNYVYYCRNSYSTDAVSIRLVKNLT